MVRPGITVCVATIPPRARLLARAAASVALQQLQPAAIVIEYDPGRTGAAATKNRALAKADTQWVTFLDDDDTMLPEHLHVLLDTALNTGADVVYSTPYVPQLGGPPTGPEHRYGEPFDADILRQRSYIHTSALARTELMQAAGGFQHPPGSPYDDWGCWLAMLEAGASFHHVDKQTFLWNHWDGNTSGDPARW